MSQNVGILALLHAKPGKEDELRAFTAEFFPASPEGPAE